MEDARASHDWLYFTHGPGKKYWCRSFTRDRTETPASRFFRLTPEGLQFWFSQDCSPESLSKVKHSTFVAIDVGGHNRESLNDLGVAVLPTFPDALLDTPLDSVSTLSASYGAQITNFSIKGRPLPEKGIERLSLGSEKEIEIHEIEACLVNLLKQVKADADALGNDLVLVLFSSSGDLNTLVKFCPEVFPFFSWWTDLQAVVCNMDQDQLSKCTPSLGDTLRSLDLCTFAEGGKSPQYPCNSANDAARTLAVLAGAVRMFRAGSLFHVKPPAPPTEKKTYDPDQAVPTKYWRNRPLPKEQYPFAVKIRRAFDPTQPLPKDKRGHQSFKFPQEYGQRADLYEVFAAYKPTAIGVKYCSSMSGVWVCFPTRECWNNSYKTTRVNSRDMDDCLFGIYLLRVITTHRKRWPGN